jgi:lipopolysaccharide/colanic/teichoic acid biosynthesis glycosyltransferase
MRGRIIYLLGNQVLIVLVFLLVIVLRGRPPIETFIRLHQGFLALLGIHLLLSLILDKYNYWGKPGLKNTFKKILLSNGVFFLVAVVVVYRYGEPVVSRFLFFGTVIMVTFLELFLGVMIEFFRELYRKDFFYEGDPDGPKLDTSVLSSPLRLSGQRAFQTVNGEATKVKILETAGQPVFDYLSSHLPLTCKTCTVMSTTDTVDIFNLNGRPLSHLVNLHRLNDVRHINKFLELTNKKLPMGGFLVVCAETNGNRKSRVFKKYKPVIGFILYCFDFLLYRVAPKINITRKLYFWITKGRNRVLTKPEILGRLYSCGFVLRKENTIAGLTFFVAQKAGDPFYDSSPSYGPLIRLRRIGKNGKVIGVFKLRTMHPFAEYLQDYVYKECELAENGKFRDDFRISRLGRFFRSVWLDELPMLLNFVKGDLKLVGVRPLSKQYFSLYPWEVQEMRTKFKPGLVPPFYADLPKSFEEIVASEKRYLEAYDKAPIKTDLRYFRKAFVNIVFKNARSS